MQPSDKPSNLSRRRPLTGSAFWLDFVLAGVAIVWMAVCVNYLVIQHPWRFLWHKDPAVMLSPLTESWVRSLTNEVRVVVFHDPDERDTPHASIMGLLNEYRHANSNIQVEVVDYLRQVDKARTIRKQFELLNDQEHESVLFAMEGRHRVVSVKELIDYTTTHVDEGGQLMMKAVGFKGEMLFTSAMMNLVEGNTPVVYCVQGHDEHDLESQDLDGYASLKYALEEKNLAVKSWNIREQGAIPDDAAALIIAGSVQQWAPEELHHLDQYVRGGGRVLIGFNFKAVGRVTGLENWLRSWRISVGQNVVEDERTFSGSELLVGNLAPHPVTNPLLGTGTPLVMSLPRSLQPMNKRMETFDVDIDLLAVTTTNGVSKSIFSNGEFLFNARSDAFHQEIPLMASLEARPSEESGLNQVPSRMIVLGDSQCFSNVHLQKVGNRDLAGLAMSWLLERDTLLGGIGPRALTEFRMDIPAKELRQLQWFMLAILPLGVFGIGFLVWLKRRY